MAFGVIVLGALMGLGGAAVMARGAPYYMLEWGVAYLASGAIAVCTGLILVVLGLMLRRLSAIEARLAALTRAPEIPVAPAVSAPIAPTPADSGLAAPASGAAAAVGATIAAMADAQQRPAETVPDTWQAGATPVAVQPDLADAARGILSSVAAREAAAPDASQMVAVAAEPALTPPPPALDPFERINKALRDLREGALGVGAAGSAPDGETDAVPAVRPEADPDLVADAGRAAGGGVDIAADASPEPFEPPAASAVAGDRPSPALDRAALLPDALGDLDELRGQLLTDQTGTLRSWEVSATVPDRDADAPGSQPPSMVEARAEHAPVLEPPLPDTEPAQPAAPETAANPAPVQSNDGVIAAYTVGDSSFTMYADGRIEAEAPEGRFTFASIDELRAFMAERRRS